MLERYKTVYRGKEGELLKRNPALLLRYVLWRQKKKRWHLLKR